MYKLVIVVVLVLVLLYAASHYARVGCFRITSPGIWGCYLTERV